VDTLTTIITSPILLTLAITLGYLGACALFPFKRCRACKGRGHHQSRLLRGYRPCRSCDGNGMRLRVGRKAWNAVTRNRRARRANRRSGN
jgi:hypothetical protein